MDRPVRVNRLVLFVVLVLMVPIAGLKSLAYAILPDPSWVHGFYDGTDYDDVVPLITSEAGTVTLPAAQVHAELDCC